MLNNFKRFLRKGPGFSASVAVTLFTLTVGFFLFLLISVIIANWDTAAVVAGLIIGVQAIVFIIVCMITLFLLSIPCHWLILKIDDWSDLRQARKIAEADAAWQADFDRRHPPAP